jgi:hypothetical protein
MKILNLSQIAKRILTIGHSHYVLRCTILGLGNTFPLFSYDEMNKY